MNSTEVYNRFISESAASAASADALWSSSMDLQMKLADDGLAARLQIAGERARCRAGRVYKNEAYGTTYEPIAIVYNKRLVAGDEVPKTHADLREAPHHQGRQVQEARSRPTTSRNPASASC